MMGDHRIDFKIEFDMHGHKKKWEAWLNWHDGIPEEIAEWVRKQHSKAMENWFDAECAREDRQRAENENKERKMLAELKAKYE